MFFICFPMHFSLFPSYGKYFTFCVYFIIYCVGAGINTLMSISDRLEPYLFRRKMEKTRSMKEEMEVFSPPESAFFPHR